MTSYQWDYMIIGGAIGACMALLIITGRWP